MKMRRGTSLLSPGGGAVRMRTRFGKNTRTPRRFVNSPHSLLAPGIAGSHAKTPDPRFRASPSCFDRDPDLHAAVAGARIEFLAVALEIGRIGELMSGCREPLAQDGVPRPPDRGDMAAMREHSVALRGNAHAAPVRRYSGKIAHFDSTDVIEVTDLVAVAAYAVGHVTNLSRNVAEARKEPLPLRRKRGATLAVVTLAQSRDQQRSAVLKARRFQFQHGGLVHLSGLHELNVAEITLRTNLLRRAAELVVESSRECLVRAVPRLQSNSQDVRRATRQRSRGFRQPATAHVAHDRMACRHTEGTRQVISGNVGEVRDLFEREILRKVSLDIPERFSDR